MTTFTTRLLLFGCILMLLPITVLAQIKKDARPQNPNQPVKVVLKTSRGATLTANVESIKGDTLIVKDKNGGITFFSIKTLQSVKFYDADGSLVENPTNTTQEDNNSVVIETQTGDIIKGKLLARRGDTVEIDIGIGKSIAVTMSQIKSLTRASSVNKTSVKTTIIDLQAPYENPFAARGLLTLNGMPLRKGQSYYQNIYGFVFHNFGFYLSDNFNMQVGTFTVPLVGYVNPNVVLPLGEYISVGAGVSFWLVPESFTTSVFGSIALGTRDNNIGFKIGKHLGEAALFENFGSTKPIPFTISAQARVANNWSLVGELLAFSPQSEFNILGVGARYFRPRLALDFGLGGVGEITKRSDCPSCQRGFFFGLPYITVSLIMGKRKK